MDGRKTNKWILNQIKPEMSLEARMTKLKLSYFGHIMRRHDSLEKTIMLRKSRGQQEERPTKYEMDQLYQRNNRYKFKSPQQHY